MSHLLRAEYGPRGRSAGASTWHVVRAADPATALCGRTMDTDAETRAEEEWGTGLRCCQQCGSLYMHEVPHMEGSHPYS
ncbi:hypothetical protein RMN57_13775 [Kitasatospora sp. CM 4170]|uniref:Uncharacterized protein n=1 Tax=Kitasatospora aburaviensis TaxID=67265 RepID=A0ABW1ERD0_9ACTN|nr:hypothetical protein [Kitasatospora sp. CM 4170]WNM45716.1 hypothetical protein RMN57_13775 [Kitasatospora sp. CM 4170]